MSAAKSASHRRRPYPCFFARMVKLRGLPFCPGDFPALDDYGVTLAQATAAEDSALAEIALSCKAGRLETFNRTSGRLDR